MLSEETIFGLWLTANHLDGDKQRLVRFARAVAEAEAAVKDAVGGDEPFTYLWVRKNANTVRHLSSNTGPHPDWEVTPLYTRPQASAAVPDLSACFITAESGGEEYKVVLRFQTLAKMQDAHSAMVHWLAASQPEVNNV